MTTENETTQETNTAPAWFIDNDVPGAGPRPDWLPEKFESAADLAKSYADLEKKFLGTVPDEYDLSKSRYLDPDYAPFQDLMSLAKEKRVPQEVFDKMLDSVDKYMDEFNLDPEEEIKKLGDNGKERINLLQNWAKANLSQESFEAIAANLRNADAIKAFEELRGKMMSNVAQVPNGNDTSTTTTATVDELKMELQNNLPKYKTDAEYRKDWSRRLEIATKNSPDYIDKVGA